MACPREPEILSVHDESRWAEVLEEIGRHDFCHLHSYSKLAELSGHGRAQMFAYRAGDYVLAFPLLVRHIEVGHIAGLGDGLHDVTSVYGYAGPIANSRAIPEHVSARFLGAIDEHFRAHRVVSAMSRMHPLLEQSAILHGLGEVVPVGWTLSVDLSLPDEQQLSAYRRNHRQDIKRLRSMGVRCEEVGVERLDDFVEMYYENMGRVHASRAYYFDRSYFEHLLTEMRGVAHLFMCHYEGAPIAGSIFTLCRGIVQWHLSGSRADFAGPPPTKLIFEVARGWAKEQGAHTLHLGGGVGGSRDSLYHFKRGFTKREHVYSIWRHVVDEDAYDELTRLISQAAGVRPDDGFFPLYRHPLFEEILSGGDRLDPARSQG